MSSDIEKNLKNSKEHYLYRVAKVGIGSMLVGEGKLSEFFSTIVSQPV